MPTYLKIILAVVLVLGLVAVFVITFLVNKKTKVPDNCPKAEIGCAGCMLNCSKREEDTSISAVSKNIVSNFKSEVGENQTGGKAGDKKEEQEKEGK